MHDGRTAGTVVYLSDCKDSPVGATELNLDQTLDALQRPGARACKDCGAAEALLTLLGAAGGSSGEDWAGSSPFWPWWCEFGMHGGWSAGLLSQARHPC
ncbi:DUF6233 domain-containing protein [Streptomyces sp. NPDC052115]|uniref:DUF6233 domain-containing protein n=1 Tax=Streptomyces sp. NPDC052115 TaxID=3155794 RepID=UPI0034442C51